MTPTSSDDAADAARDVVFWLDAYQNFQPEDGPVLAHAATLGSLARRLAEADDATLRALAEQGVTADVRFVARQMLTARGGQV